MKKQILVILTIFWIVFIFSQSLQTGNSSGQISGVFVNFFYNLFQGIGIDVDATILSQWIRKLAHVFEFMILGILMFSTMQSFFNSMQRTILYAFFSSVLVAVLDEVIQLFVEGRAGTIVDVAIDTIGIILGILIVLFVQHIRKKTKKGT